MTTTTESEYDDLSVRYWQSQWLIDEYHRHVAGLIKDIDNIIDELDEQ